MEAGTLKQIVDPKGISNWSVTHVDWKNQKWHPRSYKAEDINLQLIKEIQVAFNTFHLKSATHFHRWFNGFSAYYFCFVQSITETLHVTSDSKVA